ncbi:MAG: hypothetical protein AB8H79_14090 [Myxococcota bacterium]
MIRQLSLLLLLAAGCRNELEYEGAFTVPSAGAITEPGAQTPFSEAIAYVSNRIGGQIRPLAAESGRFLSDDPTASFLRGSPLSTGRARVLTSVAVYAPNADVLTVFAADQRFGQLLQVPHITSTDAGRPVESTVEASDMRTTGAGTVTDLDLHDGFVSTETWTFTFDGEVWKGDGSRSGKLDAGATPAEPYTPIGQPFTITFGGSPEAGATVSFDTMSGLVEHDLGAVPVKLAMAPDQGVLAIATVNDTGTDGGVIWWDPESGTIAGEVELPEGAMPVAMTWEGSRLWIADGVSNTLWWVEQDQTTPTAIELPVRAAHLASAPAVERLYLASDDDIWAVDANTGAVVDLNPFVDGVQGFPLHSPIRGLAQMSGEIQQGDDDDDGVRRTTPGLAISLYRGTVVFFDEELGCLFQDGLGPRTRAVSAQSGTVRGDHTIDFDGAAGGPELVQNASNENFVSVNNCAGIAQEEGWRLTFDQGQQGWTVEGTLSGVQQNLAYEDRRYVTDGGEIGFLIRSGVSPARDGWNLTFSIEDGVLGLTGDQDGDVLVDPNASEVGFSLPGTPLPVELYLTSDDAGWRNTTGTPAIIIPLEGANAVARGRPDLGLVDALWE